MKPSVILMTGIVIAGLHAQSEPSSLIPLDEELYLAARYYLSHHDTDVITYRNQRFTLVDDGHETYLGLLS